MTKVEANQKLYGSLQIFTQFTDQVIDLIREINIDEILSRDAAALRWELEELSDKNLLFQSDENKFTQSFIAGNWEQLKECHFLFEEAKQDLEALRHPKVFNTIMKITHLNMLQTNMGKFKSYIQIANSYKNLNLQRLRFLLIKQKCSKTFIRKVANAIDFITFPRVVEVNFEFRDCCTGI